MNKPEPFEYDDSNGGFEHAMPLMDVILLILFFFLTTSTYSSQTGEMDLNLPSSAESSSTSSEVNRVILTKQGGIMYDGSQISSGELKRVFEEMPEKDLVLISAEASVDHERVVSVMEDARSSGIGELGIEVERTTNP